MEEQCDQAEGKHFHERSLALEMGKVEGHVTAIIRRRKGSSD
jgi:hypothetical protein